MDFANGKCVPCEGGVPRKTSAEVDEALRSLGGWDPQDGKTRIHKHYRFKDFVEAMRFVNALAGVSGAVSVAAGAFGAHALKSRLAPDLLAVFETGARYQMYHALALGLAAWAAGRLGGAAPVWAGWLFVAGTVLFSGSLYALALSGVRALGAVTPFGGVAFVAGWLALAVAALSS